MINKKLIKNILYLLIATMAFSVSLFKWNNQVWIAAWIAPLFLMRFIRMNKWKPAIIFGFIALFVSNSIGYFPVAASLIMKDKLMITILLHLLSVLITTMLFLVPFILDKVFLKKEPNQSASLIFPSAFVTLEFLLYFFQGTLISLGQSQFVLAPLVIS